MQCAPSLAATRRISPEITELSKPQEARRGKRAYAVGFLSGVRSYWEAVSQ